MKKVLLFLTSALLISACYNDRDLYLKLDEMDQRVTAVEKQMKSYNEQLSQLQLLVNGKLYISGVTTKPDGTNVITLVDAYGELSTITLSNGKDGETGRTPQIGVKQTPDGKYYWTIDGEWMLDADGNKVPVTGERGVTPSMKIENGKWYVSYDYGVTYVECGQATGEDGDAFFKDAKLSEDGKLAYLTLADGTVLTFEVYKEFGISVEIPNSLIYAGQTKEYAYVITGGDKNTVLEVIPKGNWQAEVKAEDETHGVICVTAPDEAVAGKVILLLGDGASKTIMRTLTFVSGAVTVSTSSVESPANGGTFSVDVTTNLEFTAELDADQTWAHLVETKAFEVYTKTVAVTVDKNDLPYARQTRMTLKNDGNVIESIVIYQNPVVYPEDAMVLVVKPCEADNLVYLPFGAVTNTEYTVDWGDGSAPETLKVNNPKHEYADASKLYSVQVTGTLRSFSGAFNTRHESDLIEIYQWGKLNLQGIQLRSHKKLKSIAVPKGDELAAVNNCNGMFYKCESLKTVPKAFVDALSDKTTNINGMFEGCTSLEYLDPDFFSHFTATGISMWKVFLGCKSLKTIPTLNTLKLANNNQMLNQTFKDCESLEVIPEHLFNETAKTVTRTSQMVRTFENCKSLKTIPESFWENIAVDKILEFNYTFAGCESLSSESLGFLNKLMKVYKWANAFQNCKSLTTLPECEIEVDGEKVSVPIYKRDSDEYNAYFANHSYSSLNFCFKGCVNLEGYYDKIPQTWGGGWDGTTEKPTIEVTATLPEKTGYYSIDFTVKGKGVSKCYYYLTAKTIADEILPKYNNSYTELCRQKGIEIESDYLAAVNSDNGLVLGFSEGVPNVEYILIVSGSNMFGESYAYTVQSTTSVPKGTEEYERYLGEWTVTAASSAVGVAGYDSRPISFDIRIEPFRVDEIYYVYGWGVTTFTDKYPMYMFLEDGKLCAWTGSHHGSVIYYGYPYSDGISYNIALNSFYKNADGNYAVYMADGEKVGVAEYKEGGFDMVGVESVLYPGIVCTGFDFCLSMGGPGWSKIFIAPEVVKPQYIYESDGEKYAPYIMAPYTFKRKASQSRASVTESRRRAALERRECLHVDYGQKAAVADEPAKGMYKLF